MNKINVKKWHNYRLCDLFKIKPAKGKNSQQLNDGNDVPYIAASKECNGFNRMVAINGFEDWVSEGNCIQLIHIGDAAAGYANYIPDKFIAMSGKSSCAYNRNMTKYSGLFIATIICKTNKNKYSFKDSWTGDKVKNTIITLPYKTNDEPDWEYIESYMKNIMQESEENIRNLQNINNSKKKINLSNWKSFKIGSLFEPLKTGYIGSGKKIGSATKKPDKEHTIPLTCAKYGDNGIMYWGKKGDFITHSNILAVIRDGAVATGMVYAEKDETSVYSHSYFIKLKNYDVSFEVNLYLSCILTKTIYPKYTRDDTCIWERIQGDEILLPVSSNNEPDWEYMENYMKHIMQDILSKLDKLVCC
ncbi:MAG: hypothetical protein DKM23_06515 [Candidatus Melainabacteria bacterium]|nr:MAG: hypothetical protein DKM23_06515 [Candidatus Melainabacteria bacterium]